MSAKTPYLSLPDFSNGDFQRAVEVLQVCTKPALPQFGFPETFIAPGGRYGDMWWQLDFSIALLGLHWIQPEFAQKIFLNFETAQKPDGRIPLWGNDRLPDYGNIKPLQREGTSSFPRLFDAAARVASGSADEAFLTRVLNIMKKYLDWWFHDRQDKDTGLISAVFEETFIPYFGFAGEYAPVNLNVEIIHGCHVTAELAERLHQKALADDLLRKAEAIGLAVRKYLWNPADQLFASLILKDRSYRIFDPVRMGGSFAALRYQVASPEQRQAVMRALLDPERFGWGKLGVTSVDRTDPAFTLIPDGAVYNGNPCWSGSVWAFINENIVRGLLDCGERALAADLAYNTLQMFKVQYCEFLNPDTGNACGVMDYAWTASLCMDIALTYLCGISFDRLSGKLVIQPNFPASCSGKDVEVRDLPLAGGNLLSLNINCGTVPEIKAEVGTRSFCGTGKLEINL